MTMSTKVIGRLREQRLRIALAESLTGGRLVAKLIDVPGASEVVLGGVVVYNTELKKTLLEVDASILNVHGAVHPDVAIQMAVHVRDLMAVEGLPAEVGIGVTGVAGPEPQDGHEPGTVFFAIAVGSDVRVKQLSLSGDRDTIRTRVVDCVLEELCDRLGELADS